MQTGRKNVLLIVGGAAFALCAGETLLRFGGFQFSSSFYQRDFERGWKLRAGSQGWQDEEGETFVAINSHGMRDKERLVSKPAKTIRVALLGDSFTEAKQVDMDKTFGAVAEARLKTCAAVNGRTPEILNFGVSHYGTAQELMLLESEVWQWKPDVVVLAFFTGNDVYNNHPALTPIHADVTPYYRLVEGRLERVGPRDSMWAVRDWVGRAANHSRVVGMAAEAYSSAAGQAGVNAQAVSRFGSDYLDRLVYVDPETTEMREAWEVTEALIAEMNRTVHARGAKFLLMTMTTAVQVHPDAAKREGFQRKIGAKALDYPDRRLEAFAAARGIASLVLMDKMRKHAEDSGELLHGFRRGRAAAPGVGHWNETGHRVAGELLADRVCGLVAGGSKAP